MNRRRNPEEVAFFRAVINALVVVGFALVALGTAKALLELVGTASH